MGMKKKSAAWTTAALALIALLFQCGWDEEEYEGNFFDPGRGNLEFYADGEEFVREGFSSMDGWNIEFSHLFVNIERVVAKQTQTLQSASDTQTDPASETGLHAQHAGHGTPDQGSGQAVIEVPLPGAFFVDLHDPAGPALLGEQTGIVAGDYNAVDFQVIPASLDSEPVDPALAADLDEYQGYTMILVGTASSGNTVADFEIMLDEELVYTDCGPNNYAGFVSNDGTGQIYMTFHMDHVFGDFEEAPGEGVNAIALGFGPIANAFCSSSDCIVSVTQDELAGSLIGEDYLTFIDALRTVGHSGEGHCHLVIY